MCCFPSKQITTIYDIGISPDNYEDWPHTLQEMLSWAFEPADDKLLLEFIGMPISGAAAPGATVLQDTSACPDYSAMMHEILVAVAFTALGSL